MKRSKDVLHQFAVETVRKQTKLESIARILYLPHVSRKESEEKWANVQLKPVWIRPESVPSWNQLRCTEKWKIKIYNFLLFFINSVSIRSCSHCTCRESFQNYCAPLYFISWKGSSFFPLIYTCTLNMSSLITLYWDTFTCDAAHSTANAYSCINKFSFNMHCMHSCFHIRQQ